MLRRCLRSACARGLVKPVAVCGGIGGRGGVTVWTQRMCTTTTPTSAASASAATVSYAHEGALHTGDKPASTRARGSSSSDRSSSSSSDEPMASTATPSRGADASGECCKHAPDAVVPSASSSPLHASRNKGDDNNNDNDKDKGDKCSDVATPRRGFIAPSSDIVLETARHALAREGRDTVAEAEVWRWETTAVPILARGKQNVYDLTDDIPEHVKPFWYHEYYQQREYFRLQREKRPLRERARVCVALLAALAACGTLLTLFRVWVEQPRQIREMRREILQNAYGRVLELAAGHGQNIGAYPYAVHDIVLSDSNPQQLQALRYRIPHTAYPKYSVQRVRAESLDVFADGEFDCVVDMFGLCHMHDPVMALRQMQRVVKPNGVILLLEHGASPYMPVNWFLDYFQHRHTVNTHGCRWNLPIREYLREARLEVKELRNLHYGTTYYVVAYPEVLHATQQPTTAAHAPA